MPATGARFAVALFLPAIDPPHSLGIFVVFLVEAG